MDYRNIVQTVYKVSDFISWQRSGALVLSPSFQRRPVWSKPSKSFLIDTIIRGFPIPIVFLREKADLDTLEATREVVDGQQRLRTIFAFIEPALLKDYSTDNDDFTVLKSHNEEIAGLGFRDLPRDLQKRILDYKFSVHILPSNTEDSEVLQIFARMNSTGVKLNRQELRNAEFIGTFKRVSYSLAYQNLSRWRKWQVFTENNIARMLEVEETSDLLRLMLDGVHSMSQPSLDGLYAKYEEEFPYETEVTRRFNRVMDVIDDTVGALIPDTPFTRRVLFHTLFTFFYEILFGMESTLDSAIKPSHIDTRAIKTFEIASDQISRGDLSEDLARVLRGGTGNLESRLLRLEFLQDIYISVEAK